MANISYGIEKFRHETPHDPVEANTHTFVYRPLVWTANDELVDGRDMRVPSISEGFAHLVKSGGRTGATEPIWATKKNGVTIDGTVEYKAVPLEAELSTGDTIVNGTSVWQVRYFDNEKEIWVTIANATEDESIINSRITQCKVVNIPDIVKSFELINTVNILRANSITNTIQRTAIVRVVDR